jgi:hypothetical protein
VELSDFKERSCASPRFAAKKGCKSGRSVWTGRWFSQIGRGKKFKTKKTKMGIIGRSILRQRFLLGVLGGFCIAAAPRTSAYLAQINELDRRYSAGVASQASRPPGLFAPAPSNVGKLVFRTDVIGGPNAFIQNWWFNFNGSPGDPTMLASRNFAYGSINPQFNAGRDGVQWDFGFYSGASEDARGGDSVTAALYSQTGLSLSNFDAYAAAPTGPAPKDEATAKFLDVAGRYDGDGPAAFVLVPEATTVYLGFLLLAGALGGVLLRRAQSK